MKTSSNSKLIFAAVVSVILGAALFPRPAQAERPPYEAQMGLIRVGGFIVFFNSQGPLSFQTLDPSEIPKDAVDAGVVRCDSCQHGVSVPVPGIGSNRTTNISGAGGNGGFDKALANLKKERPELRGIYDVKVDTHRISVLGIYRRLCTEVTARGFK